MRSHTKISWSLAFTVGLVLAGCHAHRQEEPVVEFAGDYYREVSTQIEYPAEPSGTICEALATAPPITHGEVPEAYLPVALEAVIESGLQNSEILRDLGGVLLRSPETARSVHDPSIRETDPRFGVQAALADYDATFSSRVLTEGNDRVFNNEFFGGGTRQFQQDLYLQETELTKRAMTGTLYTLRNITEYDANNAPGNAFPSAWSTVFEGEVRHPLLRGGGVEFNRIMGPGGVPGSPNGVLIARINTDISLADFEMSVINYVSDLENAYWDLYYAYRDLEAKRKSRDRALQIWRIVKSLTDAGIESQDREQFAREQYYRFEQEVENSLTGRLVEGTRSGVGSTGGTFRTYTGVLVAERRLRMLMGIPINDNALLRPSDDPPLSDVEFDWSCLLAQSLNRRPELRRQKWRIKQLELELTASENFLQPQLDLIGRYRFRGFGDDLWTSEGGIPTDGAGNKVFQGAFDSLATGDYQEWSAGVELSFPIGARRAHAAIRHLELRIARERALLGEQERKIVLDVSNAVGEKDRAYQVLRTAYDRYRAARERFEFLEDQFLSERLDDLDRLLDAQRRLSEAESIFFHAEVEYALALKNLQLERGTLLDYNSVVLSEGGWVPEAVADAQLVQENQIITEPSYCEQPPNVVSAGVYQQTILGPPDAVFVDEVPLELVPPESTFLLEPSPTNPNAKADSQ